MFGLIAKFQFFVEMNKLLLQSCQICIVQNQHLNFSLNQYIILIWSCARWQALKIGSKWRFYIFKKSSHYAVSKVNGVLFRPKSAFKLFSEFIHIFMKLNAMAGLWSDLRTVSPNLKKSYYVPNGVNRTFWSSKSTFWILFVNLGIRCFWNYTWW